MAFYLFIYFCCFSASVLSINYFWRRWKKKWKILKIPNPSYFPHFDRQRAPSIQASQCVCVSDPRVETHFLRVCLTWKLIHLKLCLGVWSLSNGGFTFGSQGLSSQPPVSSTHGRQKGRWADACVLQWERVHFVVSCDANLPHDMRCQTGIQSDCCHRCNRCYLLKTLRNSYMLRQEDDFLKYIFSRFVLQISRELLIKCFIFLQRCLHKWVMYHIQ